MSDAESSLQVELDSGKRVKVKAANVMLRFERPAPAELIARAQTLAGEIDLDLAWEFAPEEDFGFADLARDYFDPRPAPRSRPRRCSACSRRRTTSAAWARASSARRPKRR
jgi:exoribonuclease-2